MQTTIDTMTKMNALMGQMTAVTHSMVARIRDTTIDTTELRDHIADFDDFFRPIRNYLYWEPHCYDIPVCHTLRAIFDTLDGTDTLTDDIQSLLPDLERLDSLMPQLQAMMPPQIETMKKMQRMMLEMHSTQSSQQDQQFAMNENQSAMGDAFNDSHNDDTFYLPPEIFDNSDFKRGMKNFISRMATRSDSSSPTKTIRSAPTASTASTPSRTQHSKPSRARRWRAPGSTSAAPHPPSRTCGTVTRSTC
jgi:RND superfamily putative drug exporter